MFAVIHGLENSLASFNATISGRCQNYATYQVIRPNAVGFQRPGASKTREQKYGHIPIAISVMYTKGCQFFYTLIRCFEFKLGIIILFVYYMFNYKVK